MLDANAADSDLIYEMGESPTSVAFSALVHELAHDFNNIWSTIFGFTQQVYEVPGFQEREELLQKIEASSARGLFYSRNVMEVMLGNPSQVETLDVCDWIRTWVQKTGELLGSSIDLSCLVPPQPLRICFNIASLNLFLLSLVGYALKSDSNRWAMVGVRDVPPQDNGPGSVDIIFICRHSDLTIYPLRFQRKVHAIEAIVEPHGGTVSTTVLSSVGINVRIRFPVAPSAAGMREHLSIQVENM